MFEKKKIEKKSRKHGNYAAKRQRRSSILVPSTAHPTLRINKKIDFEKCYFQHIFDHTFFLIHYVRKILHVPVPLTAQPTLRINKKIDFENSDFEHIFDDPSFF